MSRRTQRHVAQSANGTRNNELNDSAFSLFALARGLSLTGATDFVREEMQAAGEASGLAADEVRKTIASAEAGAESKGATRVPLERARETSRAGRGFVKLLGRPGSGDSDDGRAEILITANTHEVTEAMCRALRDEPELYHRDGRLVRVVASAEVRNGDVVLVPAGTPQTRDVQLSTLIDFVSTRAICKSFDARTRDYVHKAPPKERVKAVHERGEWPGLRELAGVAEHPIIGPDGSLMQTPGYDPVTRFLYQPSEAFGVVPDAPTLEQARSALAELAEVYCDFPYVNEAHRSAALALPVTLIARPAIDGPVPAWLQDASVRRSGKTKATDAASIIKTGRPAGRSIFPSAANADELAKVMGGHALAGTPLIFFDNVPSSQVFAGPVLDAYVTAEGRANFRLLGKTGDHEVEWRSVIVASGNGIECGGDLAPRVLAPRLESPLENPELRDDFRHDPLLPWVKENRARLVVAILTLLRGYVVAGRPDMKIPRWGSFEAWTGLVASALVWGGAADPTGARKSSDSTIDDPTAAAERVLVSCWKAECLANGKTALTANQFITSVYSTKPQSTPRDLASICDAVEYLTGSKPGHAPDATALGKVLRGLRARNVRGQSFAIEGETGGVARWQTKPVPQ